MSLKTGLTKYLALSKGINKSLPLRQKDIKRKKAKHELVHMLLGITSTCRRRWKKNLKKKQKPKLFECMKHWKTMRINCLFNVVSVICVRYTIFRSHIKIEPPHDKTNKMACSPSEDSDQPDQSLRCPSLATHWAHSEDSDQTGQMPRLIWVFAGRTVILLVLSWGGSNVNIWTR